MKPAFERRTPAADAGFSLLEIIIAAGLLAGLALTLATMLGYQQKENRALAEKVAVIETQRALTANFLRNVCTYLLVDPATAANRSANTFEIPNSGSNGGSSISLQSIPLGTAPDAPALVKVGELATPVARTVVVSAITVTQFQGSGDAYSALIRVEFDQKKLVRALSPVGVKVFLRVGPGAGPNQKVILDCSIQPPSSVTDPDLTANMFVTRTVGRGSPVPYALQFFGNMTGAGACAIFNDGRPFSANPARPVICEGGPGSSDPATDDPTACDLSNGPSSAPGNPMDDGQEAPIYACASGKQVRFCTAGAVGEPANWNSPSGSIGHWSSQPSSSCQTVSHSTPQVDSDGKGRPIACAFDKGAAKPLFLCHSGAWSMYCTIDFARQPAPNGGLPQLPYVLNVDCHDQTY